MEIVNMVLFPYLLIFLFPFSFGYPNRNPEHQSEEYVETSEFSVAPTSEPAYKLFKCPENENYSWCNAHCESTCATLKNPVPCSDECVSGCVCNAGYVRDLDGKCIPKDCCVSLEKESSEEDFCPPNEVFSPCLAHCQKNCTNWSDPTVPCLKICVPGCICDNGMVRGPYGNCIQPRKCPTNHDFQYHVMHQSIGDMLVDCPVNEHFDRCKAHCQKNCSNWDQEKICPRICVSGCVCDKDFVRGPFGKCVLTEKCSSLNQKPEISIKKKSLNSCPDGEQRSNFESIANSKLYCTSGNGVVELCPATFLKGCVCKKGHARGDDSRCIDRRLLPNANEIYFMHGDIRDAVQQESELSSEITEDSSDLGEASENSSFVLNTISSVILGEETDVQSNANDEVSTITTQERSADNLFLDSHGCPNNQQCYEWCREHGSRYGACFGIRRLACMCLN